MRVNALVEKFFKFLDKPRESNFKKLECPYPIIPPSVRHRGILEFKSFIIVWNLSIEMQDTFSTSVKMSRWEYIVIFNEITVQRFS